MLAALLMATLIMSVAAFILMGVDKARARRGAWRIPEATLFLFAALMGGVGGTLGMFFFRHKTKHWYFKYGMPAILLALRAIPSLLMFPLT